VQPLVIEFFLPFSHLLLLLLIIIVIMATTKAVGAAEISGDVPAKSTFLHFFSWFCVLYSKSEMKIAQLINRIVMNVKVDVN
jgi:hypothetical protein